MGWLFLHDILWKPQCPSSPDCFTSRSFLADSLDPRSASQNINLPTSILILSGQDHDPSLTENLISNSWLLAWDSKSTLLSRLFLPQLLPHSLSNCPHFLLLFSPILMGLEDWWFSSETEEESGSTDQSSPGCLCIKLLLSVYILTVLLYRYRTADSPLLTNKHLSFAPFSLTNTYLFKT